MVARWPKRGREPSTTSDVSRPPSPADATAAAAAAPRPEPDVREQTAGGPNFEDRPKVNSCSKGDTGTLDANSETNAASRQSAVAEAKGPVETSPEEQLGTGSGHRPPGGVLQPGREKTALPKKTEAAARMTEAIRGSGQPSEAAREAEAAKSELLCKAEPDVSDIEDGNGMVSTSGVITGKLGAVRDRGAATCHQEDEARGARRPPAHEDCVDWDAVLAASEEEIADVIRERGQQTRLAARCVTSIRTANTPLFSKGEQQWVCRCSF